MITIKTGICCGCQAEVPITLSQLPRNELKNSQDWEDDEIDIVFGAQINYICIEHDFIGQKCTGSGHIPQIICKDKI